MKYITMLILILMFVPGCGDGGIETIRIGSKNFTEQVLIGEIMAIMIEENTDIRVDRRFNLAGTMVCFNSLRSGALDIYAEYTGTALSVVLDGDLLADPDEVYDRVSTEYRERWNLHWLEPFGFDNAYTLTMPREKAEELGIRSVSDLVEHAGDLKAGFDAEFLNRNDGYPGLREVYGLEFGDRPRQMDPGLMYQAAAEGRVDVICGFATDGRIPALDLIILEDDRNFFPPYHAAPVVREELVRDMPEVVRVLNLLGGRIDDETMQRLNFRVDGEGERPAAVARAFLQTEGLLP
jgi:glycine betaine/choline ABC-type transport system substrate-binding protein